MTSTENKEPSRIMVVDRDEDARTLLSDIFSAAGYLVRAAESGSQAIAEARRFVPKAVYTSIFLPDMSGHELCQELRKLPMTSDALIIALTGYSTETMKQPCHFTGFDFYLAKPVGVEALLTSLSPITGYRGIQLQAGSMLQKF